MVGVGLGGTTNDPEIQTPAIATYPLESLDDIDKLDPERLKIVLSIFIKSSFKKGY